jgi:NADH:ubiquinone oxidoreductase subunit 2 (subunit N)
MPTDTNLITQEVILSTLALGILHRLAWRRQQNRPIVLLAMARTLQLLIALILYPRHILVASAWLHPEAARILQGVTFLGESIVVLLGIRCALLQKPNRFFMPVEKCISSLGKYTMDVLKSNNDEYWAAKVQMLNIVGYILQFKLAIVCLVYAGRTATGLLHLYSKHSQ